MARTAENANTKAAYEMKGRLYGESLIAKCPDLSLEYWQKFYREYGNACELSGMVNWRMAAKVRGTRQAIRQHIEKMLGTWKGY